MEKYHPSRIEKKWRQLWLGSGLYRALDPGEEGFGNPKFYCLVEFPYPSGERLHVGHARSYTALDAVARYKRMRGYNVLFPFGWDAFGLPAENFAVKTGIHPSITTAENIKKAKKQALSWGLSFDWSREINTTEPRYYKWTQWIFLQLFKKGLAYRAEILVNWCPACKINLANEEVIKKLKAQSSKLKTGSEEIEVNTCERCGAETERRVQKQWMLAITKYADRLLDDLSLVNFEARIKRQQVEWIGRKEGTVIKFSILNSQFSIDGIEVFTTRPDTIFAATFLVLSPEHPIVAQLLNFKSDAPADGSETSGVKLEEIKNYVEAAKNKSELERIGKGVGKTGFFTGLYGLNPLSGEEIPVWVSDFVLAGFGTGAIMGVPGHDGRDLDFAREFKLPVKVVVVPAEGGFPSSDSAFEGEGVMVNSGFINGLPSAQAREVVTEKLKEKGQGEKAVSYHLRDWVFSRQHYWGEPIPVVYCRKCREKSKIKNQKSKLMETVEGGIEYAIVPVPESELPVELPYVEKYQPADTGQSPLAKAEGWVETTCPNCGGKALRETDTMPNWAGSSWYYLAYLVAGKLQKSKSPPDRTSMNSIASRAGETGNAESENVFVEGKSLLDYWLPVDWYNGGMEHTTLHLLYSRFWHKFLFDLGLVSVCEPYAKRTSHGVVLGPDGSKMSKSKGNVLNPDEIVTRFGADTLRLYEMFIGPFSAAVAWNMGGLAGVYRFLNRVWDSSLKVIESGMETSDRQVLRGLAKTADKIGQDLENLRFNTAVSHLMEFHNLWQENKERVGVDTLRSFLLILAPFAPFLTEELWQRVGATEDGKWKVENGELKKGNEQSKENSQISNFPSAPDQAETGKFQFGSIHRQAWPVFTESDWAEEEATVIIQVNGKFRGRLILPVEAAQDQSTVEEKAGKLETVMRQLSSRPPKKTVFIPGSLINFVV